MKFFIKAMSLVAVVCFFAQTTEAQEILSDGWSMGVGAGYMNYYGDLTPSLEDAVKDHYKIKSDNRDLSYAVFLERRLSPGTSLMFNYNWGSISANDLIDGDSLSMIRSLNFKTEISDISASYMFRANNGRLLKSTSIIAPYFYVGIGVTNFTVFGDLKNAEGNNYSYPLDSLTTQDGDYETELSALNIEKDYKQRILNIPFGVGVKLKTGRNWSLNLQTDVKYMFTDYLDDVSDNGFRNDYENDFQEYAASPNPNYDGTVRGKTDGIENDMYAFTSLSLRYNFGRKGQPKVGKIGKTLRGKRGRKGGSFVPPIFPPSPPTSISNTNTGANSQTTTVEPLPSVDPIAVEETSEESRVEISRSKKRKDKKERRRNRNKNRGEDIEDVVVEDAFEMNDGVEEIEVEMEVIEPTPMGTVQPTQTQQPTQTTQQPTQMPAPVTTQPVPVTVPVYPSQGGGYDPVVEMYKLETDRLRSENSDLKNEKQFESLENQIESLKQMMMQNQQPQQMQPRQQYQYQQPQQYQQQPQQQYQQQPQQYQQQPQQQYQQPQQQYQQPQQQYQQPQPTQQLPQQGSTVPQQGQGQQSTQGYVSPQPAYDQYGNIIPQTGNVNAYNETVEEEDKKGKKKRFGKNKKNKKDKKNAEANGEEKKGGLMNKVLKKDDDDSVSVETYQFNFIGQDIKVNKQLRSQLKRIAKKVRKDGQLVFEAETTAANESKTNTIVVQLAQILAQDYAVEPGQITYDIKTVDMSAASTDDAQMVTIKAIY